MNHRHLQNGGTEDMNVMAVTHPAPGGTIADFVAVYKNLGRPCAITAGGLQGWVPWGRGQLHRIPLECSEEVDRAVLRDLLKRKGIWMASYLLEGNSERMPNCFDYVCRDTGYDIESLHKNARRDIRRGLRNFAVRLCTWNELAERGFTAFSDTCTRHGYSIPQKEGDWRVDPSRSQSPCYEVWGAWQGDDLSAWMTVIKIDDWAMIEAAQSCTSALKWCPNNALLYQVTRYLLVAEKRKYVTYGLSSIQANVAELSMHRYKIRMGYEAIPMHRKFVVHSLLRPWLSARVVSWGLEKLSAARPQVENLRKISGMSSLLSGREKTPLAWADEAKDHLSKIAP